MIRGLLLLAMVVVVVCLCWRGARADSVLVFNEIMYHPEGDETLWEWVELHNQMAVDLDVSGWSIQRGIDYTFPEGTIVPGRGYVVVAISPETLEAATGLTNVFGPFEKRLSNSGERLELRNNNNRLMDRVRYGEDDDWPVGADGGGVSLAKRHPDLASQDPRNWTISAQRAGTPGRANFPAADEQPVQSTLVSMNGGWRFHDSGADLGSVWRETDFDDSQWSAGPGLFYSGQTVIDAGGYESIPTLFGTGIGAGGNPITPGNPDPNYVLTQSAHSTPPPPDIPATVITHHPAWVPNDSLSYWIGPAHPGTSDVPHGNYFYRTEFDLAGFDPATVEVRFRMSVDNDLNEVFLNGQPLGIQFSGFNTFSPEYLLTNGFIAEVNRLDFHTYNGGTSPNPAGFRVRVSGTGFKPVPAQTQTAAAGITHYFRTTFSFDEDTSKTELQLGLMVADGAVVYLNGAEIHRVNMPAGGITADTYATSAVNAAVPIGPVAIPGNHLRRGTNVLAIEVRRAESGHTGMVFGAELSATVHPALRPQIAFNEIAAGNDADFRIELVNHGTSPVALDGFVLGGSGRARQGYVIPSGNVIEPGDYFVLSHTELGFNPNAGNKLFLYTPDGTVLLDGVTVRDRLRGRFPEATGRWLYPFEATFGSANLFEFREEIVINEIMYNPQATHEEPAVFEEALLLPIDHVWRYYQAGDPGAGWWLSDYSDGAWPQGPALLYVETAALPAPKNTPLTLGQITYYFRTGFEYTGETDGLELRLRPIIDDGAVFYLNGVEILRFNMPGGPVSHSTYAASGIPDASFTGPYTIAAEHLILGTNVLAVSVHQHSLASSDIVFGLELRARVQTSPGREYRESENTWIELYNRSDEAVDLAGWQIDGGVEYAFEAGTLIPPGGYLVVAEDRERMQSLYPDIAVAGNFEGRLSRMSDLLVLRDAHGNPANEVEYFDEEPWPEYADGDGSSLELRDPRADNSKAEAWAASDESGASEWKHYSYRAIAGQRVGPSNWQEFVFGFLQTGEALIDGISVIESPDGAARELIQNGSFESGAAGWRFRGNHRHSRVIEDPEDPSNRVLHLIATGPKGHMHNLIETTLAGGARIVDGREYQVSFRARWLAGSRRLNTRLYFNRAARTTLLEAPESGGTPGRRNSRFEENIGPTFSNFAHSPPVPGVGEPVTVTVTAEDPDGVSGAVLWWAANGGLWSQTVMEEQGGGSYAVALPGQGAGTVVQFYVEAGDSRGARSTFPARGRESRALYQVDDGRAALGRLQSIRIIMTASDVNWFHAATNVMSNDRLGATVVYNEQQVFHDVGIRLQASQRGRANDSRVGFTISFHPDNLFRGVQDSITLDRSGGYSGRGGPQDEIVLKHIINRAGGMTGMYDDLAHVIAPRLQHTGPALLMMAKYGDVFLGSQFEDGKSGHLFKLELIYYPTTTADGNPQGAKLPQPDEVVGTDIRDLGDDQEDYRWNFLIHNKRSHDNYEAMIRLAKAFSLSGTALDHASRELMDVDQWMRTFAMKSLTGDVDTYSHGLPHNFMMYFRPEDGKAMALLWDMDFAWHRPTSAPVVGGANVAKIINLPHNLRRYYGHLRDIIGTTYNPGYISRWTQHYGQMVGQDYSGVLSYIAERAHFVLNQLPEEAPFAITSNGGQDFMVDTSSVVLGGTAWIDLHAVRLEGNPLPVEWTWTSVTDWRVTVPLVLGANRLTVAGYDIGGNRMATREITVTSTALSGGLDSDGDGIPDVWELAHGLDPHWAGDAVLDYNGNGMTNFEEYLAGTDPRDPEGGLRLEVVEVGDGQVRLQFAAVAGRSYTIQSRDGWGGEWENRLHRAPRLKDETADFVDGAAGSSERYYRLVTPRRGD